MNIKNNYLIPNVTNAANVGDEAMLEVLIDLIYKANPNAKIILHSVEPKSHNLHKHIDIKPTLYYWAVFENTNFYNRLYRTTLVISALASYLLNLKFILNYIYKREKVIREVFNDYLNANIIVFVGGGYLRSKKGFTQSLNLVFLLFPFILAKTMVAKKIISPISIGPFAHNWHTRLTASIIKNFQLVSVRESFSKDLMQKYKIKHLYRGTDHALFLNNSGNKNNTYRGEFILGFTIRTWLDGKKQQDLELSYVSTFKSLAKKMKISIQPIVQVDAPAYGEGDAMPTERVVNALLSEGLNVLNTITVQGVEHGQAVYSSIDLLIGMRMHSNILAVTQGTLFVPVSYEYKTEGIAKDLGLADLCIKCADITPQLLLEKVEYALKNKDELERISNTKLQNIQVREKQKWIKELAI